MAKGKGGSRLLLPVIAGIGSIALGCCGAGLYIAKDIADRISGAETSNSQQDVQVNQDIDLGIKIDQFVTGRPVTEADLVNIDINVKDADVPNNTDLTVKYFMQDANKGLNPGDNGFYDSLVPLGERSDLNVNNGAGEITGFFQYESGLENTFDPGSALINPMGDNYDENAKFRFFVEVWNGDQKLDHEFWGEETSNPGKFVFSFKKDQGTSEQDLTLVERVTGEKKVFVYKQALGSRKMDSEACAVVDYFHPHLYGLSLKSRKLKMTQRVSEKTENKIKRNASDCDYNVLPMVSAFNISTIDYILNNPITSAGLIAKEIKDEGYQGVAIDLESVRAGSERSDKLVKFVKQLRKELPHEKYDIAIAVSPRFKDSEKNGYKHHAFYNYKEIAKYVDYVELMAYDFHKGRGVKPSPVMPEDKLDDVIRYAKANIPNDKIVVLFPFYGAVWKTNGRFVGPLSAPNTNKYLAQKTSSRYDNGELRIETSDRIVYAQDSKTFKRRLELMDGYNLDNVGGWRQTHATTGIFNQIENWKQR